MVKYEEFSFINKGGATYGADEPLFVRLWQPEENPKGIVQLCHGMAEHGARYNAFASFLADAGYIVFCHDMRGHGKTLAKDGITGYFAAQRGWELILDDVHALCLYIKERFPSLPIFLFGHSMGSFVASAAAVRFGKEYTGFVFCGTGGPNKAVPVAKLIASIVPADKPSQLLNKMAFGSYNKYFRPCADFAWLSRDKDVVAAYEADPLCGFCFTGAGFGDLFQGIGEVRNKHWVGAMPHKPVFLIAGEFDPVGDYGKGVRWVHQQLLQSGNRAACIEIYPGMRHEILNEKGKEKVFADVKLWLDNLV